MCNVFIPFSVICIAELELICRWMDFCSGGDNTKIPEDLDGICSMHFLRSSMTNLYDK